ncbi:MAG TPA: ATP-binding protein [Tangfeifania sp.]|nr:ATP-binding protein [Tangfeifania sp.]
MALKLDFIIEGRNFSKAGKASSQIKKVLKQLDIDTKIIKSIVVAIYEAEVNVAAHAYSGKLTAGIGENEIEVVIADKGPGIEDIGKAMEAGFSTASKEVREMGFGAGMGLPNIKKNTDEMKIESKVGEGTTLRFKCFY